MRYLQGLFNIEKYFTENKIVNGTHAHKEVYQNLQDSVDKILNRSKYNKVDLGNLFSFMVKA